MIRLLLLISLFSPLLSARTFTSLDGRELVASYVSSGDGKVTLKRSSDGQEFTLELTRLSEEDQQWVGKRKAIDAPTLLPFKPEESDEAKEAVIAEKLERIILPELSFKDAPLDEVVDKLRQESVNHDLQGTPQERGVNMWIKIPKDAKVVMPVVKEMKVRNIKLRSALMMVERLSGCPYEVTPFSVAFSPKVELAVPFEPPISWGDAFKCGYMNKELNTYISHRPQFMPKPAFKRRMEFTGKYFSLKAESYFVDEESGLIVLFAATDAKIRGEELEFAHAILDGENRFLYFPKSDPEPDPGTWYVLDFRREKSDAEPELLKPQVLIEKAGAFLEKLPEGYTGLGENKR